MEKYEEIKKLIALVDDDVEKFYIKGNKAAAVRIRKSMSSSFFMRVCLQTLHLFFYWKVLHLLIPILSVKPS